MTECSAVPADNPISDYSPVLKKDFIKTYRKELWFEVPTRRAFINITPDVEQCLTESGIKEGLLLCNAKQI